MEKKHILYIIGGPSRAGKSAVMTKIAEKRGGLAIFNSQALCRPIVKNLFAKDIPANVAALSFQGTTTFDPPSLRKTRQFKIDMSLTESAAPSLPKDAFIGMPTDYIRGIIRSIFAEERGLSEIGFEGEASSISAKGETSKQPIAIPIQGEDPVAWRALAGLLADYDRQNKHDVLIEGVAINPENITALELPNFEQRIAFVGLNDEAYAKPLLAYLQKEGEAKKDDLFADMRNSGKSDEEFIAEWIKGMVKASNDMRERAKQFNYPYFDMTEHPHAESVEIVANSLMQV